jgi:hypothetical protein
VAEHGRAILLDVVVEPDAVASPGQNIGQRRADFERIVHVVTVQLDHWNRLILARVPFAEDPGTRGEKLCREQTEQTAEAQAAEACHATSVLLQPSERTSDRRKQSK